MADELTADELLADLPPEIRPTAERLRRLIRRTVPEATEHVYPVWRGIGYRHPVKGYFCGIFPLRDRVRLGFEWGVRLNDPDRILEGTGKQVRYVVIREGQMIPTAPIQRLLRAALRLSRRPRS